MINSTCKNTDIERRIGTNRKILFKIFNFLICQNFKTTEITYNILKGLSIKMKHNTFFTNSHKRT